MSRWKKLLILISITSICVLLGGAFYILSWSFVKDNNHVRKQLEDCSVPGKLNYHYYGGDSMRYVIIPNKGRHTPILLMIHGAPGSCSDCSIYWQSDHLAEQYELISIDRPGYGKDKNNVDDVSIEAQASIILDLLLQVSDKRKVAILSHSYGGPVGALIANSLDSLSIGHVMISPVIDPESEEVFWYSSLPLVWPFSIFSSNDWKIASKEKINHIPQLEKLVHVWQNIKSPTIHIHGTKDWLASPENLNFCLEKFDANYYKQIVIEEGSHFILWDDSVKKIIIDELSSLI